MKEEPVLTGDELFLFNQGTFNRCYRKLGAHPSAENGEAGVRFTVWAPGVKSVSVVGEFNGWRSYEYCMSPLGASGIWSIFIAGVGEGVLYKYLIETEDGTQNFKADPYAFAAKA